MEEKVVDFILELAQVSDKEATLEELVAAEAADAQTKKASDSDAGADTDKPAKKKRATKTKKKAPAADKD